MSFNTSVIIATCNREKELAKCLKSIERQTVLPDEVIIVDSSDNPNELEKICESYKKFPLEYIYTSDRSSARQRNKGIDTSKGVVIFFFDDDVELEKEYIEKIIEVYQDNILTNIGGVHGIDMNIRKPYLRNKKLLLFYRFFLLKRRDNFSKLLSSGASVHLEMAWPKIRYSKAPIKVYIASTCNVSFHRKVLEEFKFDKKYGGYSHGEDVDLSYRISQKYNIYFTSSAKIFHNQPSDKINWYKTEDYIRSSIRAQVFLFRKHLSNRILNYFAILWSWLGWLILYRIIERKKNRLHAYLNIMRSEFLNIFKRIS